MVEEGGRLTNLDRCYRVRDAICINRFKCSFTKEALFYASVTFSLSTAQQKCIQMLERTLLSFGKALDFIPIRGNLHYFEGMFIKIIFGLWAEKNSARGSNKDPYN